MIELIFYCRPGFENDTAGELMHRLAESGLGGYVKTDQQSGFVRLCGTSPVKPQAYCTAMPFHSLIFPRQRFIKCFEITDMASEDRISPILEAVSKVGPVTEMWQEYPDTNDGKSISRLTKKLEKPLLKLFKQKRVFSSDAHQRLHLFWLSGQHVIGGVSLTDNSAPWEMGYPRLRFPGGAPSRSTLKLEEAWLQLLTPGERANLLKPGFRAVDLGAAPGGWTWQLVNKGMTVLAIDNGPMSPDLMATGKVTHLTEDAFSYRPERVYDWLVCDIVDKPSRVMELMIRWICGRGCKYAMFNLKLPMKKRWATVEELLAKLADEIGETDLNRDIRAKQLYHDRDEITVFVGPSH